MNDHEKVRRVLWVLNKFKIPYTISKHETCCGHLARSMGDIKTAEVLEQKMRELINDLGFKKIIVSCPHCYDQLKDIFSGTLVEITHITELISNKLRSSGSKKIFRLRAKVAYHDPCYLSKDYSDDIPRDILKNLGCTVVEKAHSKNEAFCCGSSWGYETIHPKSALRIATLHLNETQDAGAEYLVTNCSYCYNLFSKAKKKNKSKIKVMDLLSFVVKSLKWV